MSPMGSGCDLLGWLSGFGLPDAGLGEAVETRVASAEPIRCSAGRTAASRVMVVEMTAAS